ncbi:TetR/AcrR family transcriptional regulator [Deinococcus sonorensis]|uniref:TetR/AcrR family transcriptional regulator n=2 Tax=Deinococcus sonorensis TaxID=309891 RepID=A0AAU7U564_9DEIO
MPHDPPTSKRRRGAALEQALIRAAADELLAAGYANFTMDQVARRAGTNKNALYRRWPSRAALAFAAYGQLAADHFTPPDTGDLREDILSIMRGANQHWASPLGEVLRGLLADLQRDPELLKQVQAMGAQSGAHLFLVVLNRAVARGEARPEALHPRVAGVALALLRHEYFMRGAPEVPDAVLAEIVDEVYLPLVRSR